MSFDPMSIHLHIAPRYGVAPEDRVARDDSAAMASVSVRNRRAEGERAQ